MGLLSRERVTAWVEDPSAAPMLLVTGGTLAPVSRAYSCIHGAEAISLPAPERVNVAINVNQRVTEAQSRANVVGVVFELSSTTGLIPVAERVVRSVPSTMRALIVIDALDQAEDEGADEFLRAIAAVVRAARDSGVRVLCTRDEFAA